MLTTKRNELEVINSFNDLMKDTKEKQKINKLIREISREYFTKKIYDIEEEQDNLNIILDLSKHYNLHSYRIAKKIEQELKDEYCYIEDYYDGSIDETGRKITKQRYVYDDSRFGKNFGTDLVEDINNLVIEDYFKNLEKALEMYKFNSKIEKMKETVKKKSIKDNSSEIEDIIHKELKETYNYYKEKGKSNYTIVRNFKTNKEVIDYLYNNILGSIKTELDIETNKDSIKTIFNEELRRFLQTIDTTDDEEEESKIPMGWKFYAATKFIDNLFK